MITNLELIENIAKSELPILMSTGMSTLEEVDNAVSALLRDTDNFAIMHCNSSYPTKPSEINLNNIPMLKERYNCVVGYSGHENDLEPSIVAYALGAKIIERHITLSMKWGTDQRQVCIRHAMNMLKNRIDSISHALGIRKR